jgi:protein gp37
MSKCGIPYVVNDDGSAGQVCQAVRGCTPVGKDRGCRECYARRLAAGRLRNVEAYKGLATERGWTGKVRLCLDELDKPLRRRKPSTWFVADMGDICHPKVSDGFLLHLFDMMRKARLQRFLLLTKRPERLADWLAKWADATTGEPGGFQDARGPKAVRKAHPSPRGQMFAEYLELMGGDPPPGCAYPTFDWLEGMRRWPATWYLPNVWIGTSAEGRPELEERVPQLLRLPIACAGFWLSAEPQFEDLGDVMEYLAPAVDWEHFPGPCRHGRAPWTRCTEGCDHSRPGLSFVVQGCESGPEAKRRPFDPAWARSLHEQCQLADSKPGNSVTYFYKQAPALGGGVDKMPELYGRTWRDVPWAR